MLTWNQVLTYVKGRLALPSSFIEKTDEEIKDWCKLTSLKEFSQYYPDSERTSVLPHIAEYQHDTRNSWYYFFDEENSEILGIKECYWPCTDNFISGHPPTGATSFEGMKWWSLSVFKARFFSPFSAWSKTYRFRAPNIVEVLGDDSISTLATNFVVEYERVHPDDLRKIPVSLHRVFMDLCLADTMIMIGSIRRGYTEINTPFGQIPLNADALLSEGQEMRRDLIEKMERGSLPAVIIDIG